MESSPKASLPCGHSVLIIVVESAELLEAMAGTGRREMGVGKKADAERIHPTKTRKKAPRMIAKRRGSAKAPRMSR